MSKMLLISIPKNFHAQISEHEIIKRLGECSSISKDILQKLRFHLSVGTELLIIEIFINAKPLLVWLNNKKKRDTGLTILTSVIQYLLTFYERISLKIFNLENGESEDDAILITHENLTINDIAIMEFNTLRNIEYIFAKCKIFIFQDVEVELIKPLKVDVDNTAIGFISEYNVIAIDFDMAKKLLTEAVEKDEGILVGYGSLIEEELPSGTNEKSYWRKGRAFFGV